MHDRTATRTSRPLISRNAFAAGGAALAGSHHRPLGTGQPLPGFPESWGLSHQDVVDIVAGLVIVVLLGVVLWLRVRRRRRTERAHAQRAPVRTFPATAETWRGAGRADSGGTLPRFEASSVVLPPVGWAPGWYPVAGDPGRLAYWDGANWTAVVRWDGQRWVDAAATPAG